MRMATVSCRKGWAGFKPAPTARGALLSTVIAITMALRGAHRGMKVATASCSRAGRVSNPPLRREGRCYLLSSQSLWACEGCTRGGKWRRRPVRGLGGFQTRPYGERGVAIYCHRNHYGLVRGAQGEESGGGVLFEGWAGFKPAPTARGALPSTVKAITMGL